MNLIRHVPRWLYRYSQNRRELPRVTIADIALTLWVALWIALDGLRDGHVQWIWYLAAAVCGLNWLVLVFDWRQLVRRERRA